jgi:hypothetical protein
VSTSNHTHVALASDRLTPVLNARYALRGRHALVCAGFAALFIYLSYIPLFHGNSLATQSKIQKYKNDRRL